MFSQSSSFTVNRCEINMHLGTQCAVGSLYLLSPNFQLFCGHKFIRLRF